MKIVDFNPKLFSVDDICHYYDQTKGAICLKFDRLRNPDFESDFLGLSELEIDEEKRLLLAELSIESAFFLLAYIESLFRTDFVLRLESGKWQDQLTKSFKSLQRKSAPQRKIYTYSLVDDIFARWKEYGASTKEMTDILNTLPQYFDFRNWVAHGRYWVYKENNYWRKYNYESILILLGKIESTFGSKFKRKNFGLTNG